MHRLRRQVAIGSSLRALGALAVVAAAASPALACEDRGGRPDPLEITFPFSPPVPSTGALHPLSIPAYSSLPGAHAKIFLDFAGEQNYDWAGYSPGVTPAYDVD